MSRMESDKGGRRIRRQFTAEFKAGAVRLVLDEGKTVGAVARELDLTGSSLTKWVQQARANRTHGKTGLTTAEREELAAAEGKSHSRRGAGHPKKSDGLLREAKPVRFRFIAAEKAPCRDDPLSVFAGDPERLLRLADTPGVPTCAERPPTEGASPGVVRREQTSLWQSARPCFSVLYANQVVSHYLAPNAVNVCILCCILTGAQICKLAYDGMNQRSAGAS